MVDRHNSICTQVRLWSLSLIKGVPSEVWDWEQINIGKRDCHSLNRGLWMISKCINKVMFYVNISIILTIGYWDTSCYPNWSHIINTYQIKMKSESLMSKGFNEYYRRKGGTESPTYKVCNKLRQSNKIS